MLIIFYNMINNYSSLLMTPRFLEQLPASSISAVLATAVSTAKMEGKCISNFFSDNPCGFTFKSFLPKWRRVYRRKAQCRLHRMSHQNKIWKYSQGNASMLSSPESPEMWWLRSFKNSKIDPVLSPTQIHRQLPSPVPWEDRLIAYYF